uniref:F-box family protein n=1 Tax=Solanum tuberosum TaxID=4113 RepID=M1D9B8_SOLTU
MDILIRLPVPSLLRFKCASKFWKTLISDQYFKAKHYNYAKNNKKILIARLISGADISYYCSSLSLSQPLQNLCCPSNHKPCNYKILCCCNGLALLWYRGDHLLWNPSTNESVQLPNHEITSLFGSTCGLGYDSISDDYKILRVEHMGNRPGLPSKILALKSGSWRKIGNHPRGFHNNTVSSKSSLSFVRGAFHWLGKDNLPKYNIMISFNISNELYGEISLPEEICNISNVNYVSCAVLEGMLCAYCKGRETGLDTFKLWVMKDYGVKESWTKLFTIRKTHIFLVTPIYMFADGEVLLLYQEDGFYRDFRTSKGPYEPLPSNRTLLQGCVYTESLISPKLLI